MSFLIPLGFLGLLGLVVLLLIYIIKPNYQNKLISSTYIWKLSLKYQKKRIPISKLRNVLLLLCQILVLCLCAFLLAQPIVMADAESNGSQKVIIIDASASMQSFCDGETRFERAIGRVRDYVDDVLNSNSTVSVILAGKEAEFVAEGITDADRDELFASLDDLLTDDTACTFGTADVDGAMVLAESITAYNEDSEVLFFTGKSYLNPGKVTVVDVSADGEWNVSIQNCSATLEEGFYTFSVEVVSYGRDVQLDLKCYVDPGENMNGKEYVQRVQLSGDIVRTIDFKTYLEDNVVNRISEFRSVRAYVSVEDNFTYDNSFTLYGGIKPTLGVQYYSSKPNTFFSAALMSIESSLRRRWDIDLDEVRGTNVPAVEGYDLYVFEDKMPADMPTDGVVVLVNPQSLPSQLNEVSLGQSVNGLQSLSSGDSQHPLLNYMDATKIQVSRFTELRINDPSVDVIMSCAGFPVVVASQKKSSGLKYVIISFSVNYSDISMTPNFATFVYNIFQYYLPSTFPQYVYDIYDTVELNSRVTEMEVVGPGVSETINVFPSKLYLDSLGSYTITQILYNGKVVENFFVKVPNKECNIVEVIDVLPEPVMLTKLGEVFDDLLVYFAAILVALLLAEWFLQSRTSI